MTRHYPDLYFFLFLLAGLATFLAIFYECSQKFRWKPAVVEQSRSTEKAVESPSPPKHPPSVPKKYLENVKPVDGLQRDRPRPTEERHVTEEIDESGQAGKQAVEQFNRLCESVKDLPPKEQASRLREYFGIVGGARPARRPCQRGNGNGRDGTRGAR